MNTLNFFNSSSPFKHWGNLSAHNGNAAGQTGANQQRSAITVLTVDQLAAAARQRDHFISSLPGQDGLITYGKPVHKAEKVDQPVPPAELSSQITAFNTKMVSLLQEVGVGCGGKKRGMTPDQCLGNYCFEANTISSTADYHPHLWRFGGKSQNFRFLEPLLPSRGKYGREGVARGKFPPNNCSNQQEENYVENHQPEIVQNLSFLPGGGVFDEDEAVKVSVWGGTATGFWKKK